MLDGAAHLLQAREIAIMSGQTSHQFPDPLNWIQIRAIRWQKVQCKPGRTLSAPLLMEFCVMVFGIVENQLDFSSGMATHGTQVTHEDKEAFSIKLIGPMKHEFAIPQAHGSDVTNALARWMVIKNRVFRFRGNPHSAA